MEWCRGRERGRARAEPEAPTRLSPLSPLRRGSGGALITSRAGAAFSNPAAGRLGVSHRTARPDGASDSEARPSPNSDSSGSSGGGEPSRLSPGRSSPHPELPPRPFGFPPSPSPHPVESLLYHQHGDLRRKRPRAARCCSATHAARRRNAAICAPCAGGEERA